MTSIKKLLSDILFIDIETVSISSDLDKLDSALQDLWQIKARQIRRNAILEKNEIEDLYKKRSGIYSEFSKIVCISVGIFTQENGKLIFKTKSFCDEDEKEILINFCKLIKDHYDESKKGSFCGHNIREFDIPFICRRLIINNLPIPRVLNIAGKKPWQVNHLIDTLQLWRFGDYKNYTSLNLISNVLGINSSKDDIDGSQIHSVYYEDYDLDRIATYCEKDVFCCARVYARMMFIDLPHDLELKSVTKTFSI